MLGLSTGFSFGEPYALGLIFFGVVFLAGAGALSHQKERSFSASIVYLGFGLIAAVALWLLDERPIDPLRDAELVQHITELALILAVFTTGLSLERSLTLRDWGSTLVLLAVVMPLTIVAVALVGTLGLGLSLGAAVTLGAVLAPTDPVLAGDLGVGGPGTGVSQGEARFALSAEAAINDGLASPFVLMGLLIAGGEGLGGWLGSWAWADLLYPVAVGLVVGAGGGYGGAALTIRLRERGLLLPQIDPWLAIPVIFVTYGVAEALSSYGLLAVFAAGLAFRRYEFGHEYNQRVHEGSELVEKFAELAVILMVGTLVTVGGLLEAGPGGWLLAALLLLVIRPALVFALLSGNRSLDASGRLFVGWFGVRGVAAVFYASFVVASGALDPAEATRVFWIAIVCVAASIVVHGLTATRLSARWVED